ncbi:LysM peptidoglycan-binding domain-containing protein [Bacillus sp. V3B]|uniref:CAP domain-containing protein n=1 Tax=Bacillus sp. V3B TaxID=2804915 RepID=UPI002109ABE8|nr:CAP domain-containing protein [Bacillus sp. V3B]MCQ6275098.1 LysM peptidoglycan-binding domain-containing protein [Bacillus sp. V3B]
MKKLLSFMLTVAISLGMASPITTHAQSITMFKEPPFEFYKISKGDTFWFIAKRYGLDYKRLMELNPETNPYNMQVGGIIRLKPTSAPVSSFEEEVVRLVNQERAKQGLAPLSHRADVKNVAEKKAMDMIHSNYFSHTSPNYGSPFDMLKSFGITYRSAGENIAKGQKSPQEVMNAWMNSSGHRANILNRNYNGIGVGFYNGAWVQLFVQSN